MSNKAQSARDTLGDWPIWEVLGKGLDYLFYVATTAFLFALVFEWARSSFLLILVSAVLALALAMNDILRNTD